jgi:FkbM family methyltransferase
VAVAVQRFLERLRRPRRPPSSERWPEHKLRLVDVGGAGGLQEKWLARAGEIAPIVFEPNPAEAAKLRRSISEIFGGGGLVVERGLSNVAGPQDLHITQYWGCASLRKPNWDVLSRYRIRPAFEVLRTKSIFCSRYDELYRSGEVPQPDAIKLDVQGQEYEVLDGFGSLLRTCLGIELETHLYPIYQGQKLLHDLVALLSDFGFVLRRLQPVPNFDGDVVEIDAWFTKSIEQWRQFDARQKGKFRLICETWDLIDYSRIDPRQPHTRIET